jgi:hypothetical protein
MHLVLATIERELLAKFSWVPSGAQHRRRFLQLKAQVPDISDDQVITQTIKALCARPLHSHLVRERPKTVVELYEEFTKFSKLEVLHFHKPKQQRKVPKHDEAARPARYNDN